MHGNKQSKGHFMEPKVSQELGVIIGYARDEAMRTGHYGLGTDHLMLGLLRHASNDACRTLEGLGLKLQDMKSYIDAMVFRPEGIPYSDEDRIALTRKAQSVLNMAILESLKTRQESTCAIHLLLAISRTSGNAGVDFLSERGINYDTLRTYMNSHGMLKAPEDDITTKAEDLARSMEEEMRKALGTVGLFQNNTYKS